MQAPFREPIYVTRPLLPSISKVSKRLEEIWASKWLTNNGPQHEQLEAHLKEYLHTDKLVLFNNGTLALILGIKALSLKGEVITTPFTFPATVEALDWNRIKPVFCDINPNDLTIDATKIEGLISERTTAILGVHVFGNPCNVGLIDEIASKYKLKVIYDGAHSFGSKINGVPISTYGDMTMYSFHATKLFNTVEGGALSFKDPALEYQLKLLKNFGIDNEEVYLSGMNAKMNELQSAIGLEVLKEVEAEREKRQRLKKVYEQQFSEIPGVSVVNKDSNSFQYFAIRINEKEFGKSRDWVNEKLKEYNVFTRRYFYPLCSSFDWYADLESARPENLQAANIAVKEVLSLPFYGDLDLDSAWRIGEIFKEINS